jgi:DNA-binding GntR family transcriptional regulator
MREMPRDNAIGAYHQIRQGIVEGLYRPGERIVEKRLADDLQLSRTPIREAIRMLQSEGLVHSLPNRGATVRALTAEGIGDLYEVRGRLEALAGELAAGRATAEQLERLEAAEAGFAAAVRKMDVNDIEAIRTVFRLNDEFHLVMLESAGNERLTQTLIRTVDHPLVFQAFRHYNLPAMRRSAQFHRLIFEAIAAGESSRAGNLVLEHVLQGRDQLLAVVGDSESVDALFDMPPLAATEAGHRTT